MTNAKRQLRGKTKQDIEEIKYQSVVLCVGVMDLK
ncbi:hypothetical protein PE36_13599 [Moritella sp. PE36]|nr:hypothetical protein PE36_13599 [Moritella sp. PE36]